MTEKGNERILDSASETEVTELQGAVFEGAKTVTLTSEYSATATSATPNELIFIGWPNDETMVVGSTLNVYPFDDTTDQSVQVQWLYDPDMICLQMEEIVSQCYRTRILALRAGTTTISACYGSRSYSMTLTIKPQMQIYLSPAPHQKGYTLPDDSPYSGCEWNEQMVMEHIADMLYDYLSEYCVRVLISDIYHGDDKESLFQKRAYASSDWIEDKTNALHLALHSNAAPSNAPGSASGGRGYNNDVLNAKEVALNLVSAINPFLPEGESLTPRTPVNDTLHELHYTKKENVPAIIFEIAFHDNPDEAEFLVGNQELIAEEIGRTLVSYYNLVRK